MLGGLRVLELCAGWAGPLAGRMLAELGADVIKVEPPAGDPLRAVGAPERDGTGYAFHLVNPNKRSLIADPQSSADLALLERLARAAEIVLEGDPQPEWLVAVPRPPAQIRCAVTPFGRTGPLAGAPGADLILQAITGIMATTGFDGGAPVRIGPTVADHGTALMAVVDIVAALCARADTGAGQAIDVAGFDAMISYLNAFLGSALLTGAAPPRQGNRHTSTAPWNAYPTSDGAVLLCTSTEPQWRAVLQLIEREDALADPCYATVSKRRANAVDVDALIAAWTSVRATSEVMQLGEAARLPIAIVAELDDLMHAPAFAEREMIRRLSVPGGEVVVPGSLFAGEGAVDRAAPALGAGGSDAARAWLAGTPG